MSTHPPRFAMPRARRSIRALGLALMAFALLLPAAPIAAAATGCQSVYTGNHKGGVDVTSSLNRWLDNHRGRQSVHSSGWVSPRQPAGPQCGRQTVRRVLRG